jgi:lipopolysaccharide transport system ATP-binding protein
MRDWGLVLFCRCRVAYFSTHLGKNYEWRDLAVVFNVVNTEQQEFVGVSWLPPELEIS